MTDTYISVSYRIQHNFVSFKVFLLFSNTNRNFHWFITNGKFITQSHSVSLDQKAKPVSQNACISWVFMRLFSLVLAKSLHPFIASHCIVMQVLSGMGIGVDLFWVYMICCFCVTINPLMPVGNYSYQ